MYIAIDLTPKLNINLINLKINLYPFDTLSTHECIRVYKECALTDNTAKLTGEYKKKTSSKRTKNQRNK